MAAYHLAVTVHLLAALLWLGGMFFFAVVGAPALRKLDSPGLRADLFRRLGEQFRPVAWGAIGVLLATGVLNLHFRGLLRGDLLGDPAFWSGAAGTALAWKLGCVAVMLGLSAVHDFVLGPAAGRAEAGSPRASRYRAWAAQMARANALVGLVLVYWAVRLARGG